MSVAYIVSRFPHVSETFILRELDGVEAAGVEIELLSLFPPVDGTVHPAAERWMPRLRRGTARGALAGLASWAVRRPLRLASTIGIVARAYARRPGLLLRALATVGIAAGHARDLRGSAVEHVHAHYATYPALTAWTCARLTGIPYSFTGHAHDLYVDQSMLSRLLLDARFSVTISEHNRRLLGHHGGAAAAPVHLVRCGVDPAAYAFRPRVPPGSGPVRALCVASLQEYKGHAHLLDALAGQDGGTRMDRDLARVELDLVGRGELRAVLEKRVRRLGLAGRVRFHGALPEPEVAAMLARADLFVLPSIVVARTGLTEGVPVALMEALAAGVPVVATRVSGVPELIRDRETGLLAEPADPVSLRAALGRCLAEPDAALRRAHAGRALVESAHDVRASAAAMATLLSPARQPPPARGLALRCGGVPQWPLGTDGPKT